MILDSSNTTGKTVKMRDGRSLGYAEYGHTEGKPVFYFHGYPSSRLETELVAEVISKDDIRLIGIDRPGMGLSDFKADRQILDWPDDVVQLADALEIDRFSVLGVSGGGPYAAACAFKIPDRLTVCGIIAGIGPIDFGIEGMKMKNRVFLFIARRLPWVYRLLLWFVLGRHRRWIQNNEKIEKLSSKVIAGFLEVDRNAMEDPKMQRLFILGLLEACRHGTRGLAHEAKLYTLPWGFRLEDISFDKVYLWHGGLDEDVPVSMGQAIAKAIPNCQATFYPNDGHLSVGLNHLEEIREAMIS